MFSILYSKVQDQIPETTARPLFFPDLNLDQVIDSVAASFEGQDISHLFHSLPGEKEDIIYRQEVFRDLENGALLESIDDFVKAMRSVRLALDGADKFHYRHQRDRLFLDAAAEYCDAVLTLQADLSTLPLRSPGFSRLHGILCELTGSGLFTSLLSESRSLQKELASIRYCVKIMGTLVEVNKYRGQKDYTESVGKTFGQFQQGSLVELKDQPVFFLEMNHVEARILAFVAELFPDLFGKIEKFREAREGFIDGQVTRFEKEVLFYLSYIEHVDRLRDKGLSFCYPRMTDDTGQVKARGGFDIALAGKLSPEGIPVVPNDFYLEGRERIFVVTGPNQGGKTTFARMFGQLHYLARLGCPVPGREAVLLFFDRIFTHFEREEDIRDQQGKLQGDLLDIRKTLEAATEKSIVVFNEIFTSTTLEDAVFLSREVAMKMIEKGMPCVWVTFLDELASLSEATVSMTSIADPSNPGKCTFRIIRRGADGLAHAMALAGRHRLTAGDIRERIRP